MTADGEAAFFGLGRLPGLLAADKAVSELLQNWRFAKSVAAVPGLRAPLVAALVRERQRQGASGALLLVCATSRECESLERSLKALLPDVCCAEFPAWETLPHERLSPSPDTVGRRARVLYDLRKARAAGKPFAVLASVRAVLQPVSPQVVAAEPLLLRHEEFVAGGFNEFIAALVQFGYERVDMVTRRGEFAVRGGIIDIFPVTSEQAVRAEFFGDEVEQMRFFSVADQRTAGESLPEVAVFPARELLLTAKVRERARELLGIFPALGQMLEQVANGVPVTGMESLLSQLVPGCLPLSALLGDTADAPMASGAGVVLSPELVTLRAVSLAETNQEFFAAAWDAATAGGAVPVPAHDDSMLSLPEVKAFVPGMPWWEISGFQGDADSASEQDSVQSADAAEVPELLGKPLPAPLPGQDAAQQAFTYMREMLKKQNTVVLAIPSQGMRERARDLLAAASFPVEILEELPAKLAPGTLLVVPGDVEDGFVLESAKLVVAGEKFFFGRAVSTAADGSRRVVRRRGKNIVDPLSLKQGDYVVHETHGIGQFVELAQRLVPTGVGREKTQREFVVLEYAATKRGMPRDRLYVPTDQLDQLSRYVGGENPTLSKMGGSDWANTKKKARKAVRDIAVELVKLYAARSQAKGFAFSPDTPWQHELEGSFAYPETLDQLTTIDEVKRDMESPRPMDRLIAGDVGFGKTEIAVRAAFKAVQDGKQVAVLVPTTLLVHQHMETFQSRFAGFPVKLRALSRLQSDGEARDTINGLAAGTVDVVIGTHRVLSQGVKFHDLGLVIIDEEQRFGVEHKDALKKLKVGVDVLAMSATPIPRTLELAVTGIREMSTLATPPENRHPILTFVGPRSDRQIAAAIRRELLREGQVFFVHNRVQSIGRVAAHIQELVPEARVAVAHGRLSEQQLETVVQEFWERKFDVLVSTTIVETGLDIANANTIIIDQADKYGLSQLHQLRGRVGRSRERAYAYFLFDPDKPLTEHAHERLDTLAANNELGSGMQVALKDLELRGAGNLLGGEQSGHIAGVGFDLYLRMIGEAVNTFKGEEQSGSRELVLELPVQAFIPESYVESERLRLEAYQKFSAAAHPQADADAVDLVLEELTDRYGQAPPEVLELARVSGLRRRAARLELSQCVVAGGKLRIEKVALLDSRRMRMQRMYPGARWSEQSQVLQIPVPHRSPSSSPLARGEEASVDLVEWVGQVFRALLEDPSPGDAAV